MEPMAWTDARLDDAFAHIDQQFDLLRSDMAGVRADLHAEIADLRTEMRGGFARIDGAVTELGRGVRAELQVLHGRAHASQQQFARVGWMVGLAAFAQFCALLTALVVALS